MIDNNDSEVKPLDIVHTKCKDCIFAQFDENNIQQGCELNRIQLFHEKGVNLLETEEDGKVFYTIAGKFCYYCRDKGWAEIYKKAGRTDYAQIVNDELETHFNAIIHANDDFEATMKTYRSLIASSVQPKHITILTYKDDKTPVNKYARILRTIPFARWKIEQLQKSNQYTKKAPDAQLVFNIHKYPYTLVCEAGSTFDTDLFKTISTKIGEELLVFAVIKLSGGLFISRAIMDYLNVYYNDIELILEDEKCQHLILNF